MATRPDNLETTRLSLELLRRIPRHRKVTAAELREQLAAIGLQRDVRSIQRLLTELSEQFDIERDSSGKPYGYRWKENAAPLAVPLLSPQDALLLSLAEHYLRPLLPASIARSLSAFFEQGRRNLHHGSTARLEREWMDKVAVASTTQPLLPPRIEEGVFEAVSEALYRNLWLDLDYRNASSERRQARVMPLGLAQQGPSLYLVARFEGYDDERSLALHRMLSASATTQAFERPAGFSLARYDADGRFGFGEGRHVRLHLSIATAHGRHLLETPLSEDQSVREDGDVLHVTATVVESQWLWNWIRSFGDAVSSAHVEPLAKSAQSKLRTKVSS
jgi:predicted DNA-binding transcriptional regulator YafY